jgi:hypothetical protein
LEHLEQVGDRMKPGWTAVPGILILVLGVVAAIGMPYVYWRWHRTGSVRQTFRRYTLQLVALECACGSAVCGGLRGILVFGNASDVLYILASTGMLAALLLAGFASRPADDASGQSTLRKRNSAGETGFLPRPNVPPGQPLSGADRHTALMAFRHRVMRRTAYLFVIVALTEVLVDLFLDPVISAPFHLYLRHYVVSSGLMILFTLMFFVTFAAVWYMIGRARIRHW